jgi:hypothetical protein
MQESFSIWSTASVPWTFTDRETILVGEAPGLVAQITHDRAGRYNVLLTTPSARILSAGTRHGIAKAVAFALESGDTFACRVAQKMSRPALFSTDGPSSTVSFSQVRENSTGRA